MASIRLTWAASAGATAGTYRIRYWLASSPNSVQVVDPVTGTSYTILGLNDNVLYSGTIESKCSDGSYSNPINWSVNTTPAGSGGTTLTTAINGDNVATCAYGSSGTITIASGTFKKVRLTTTYTSSGLNNNQSSFVSITNATTGASIISLSNTAPTLYTPYSVTSTDSLPTGTYNYSMSALSCFNGNGNSQIFLVD